MISKHRHSGYSIDKLLCTYEPIPSNVKPSQILRFRVTVAHYYEISFYITFDACIKVHLIPGTPTDHFWDLKLNNAMKLSKL